MRKIVLTVIFMAVVFSAFGCGKKAENVQENSEISENSTQSAEEVQEETEPPVEKPTERVRDIEESEGFEYEIIDGGAVITKYTGSDAYVDIPDTLGGSPVTEIGFYAFEAQHDIKSVIVPETVTLIGEGAFMDCSSMESINIPEAVTGIERGAFVSCMSLSEITIPANVQYVHEEAFTACEGLLYLYVNNPDLAYESWGLEELPNVLVIAEENSAVAQWATEMGKY